VSRTPGEYRDDLCPAVAGAWGEPQRGRRGFAQSRPSKLPVRSSSNIRQWRRWRWDRSGSSFGARLGNEDDENLGTMLGIGLPGPRQA